MRLLSLFPLVASAAAHASPLQVRPAAPKALYFITNQTPNQVVALQVNQHGVVSAGSVTLTGGNGGVSVLSDGVPVPADSLNSQDSVVRSGDMLYVVNAGSNSVSSLSIDPSDPTRLSLVEPPTKLVGEFPITIAISEELNLLCVGTTGAKNGVECFHIGGGLTRDGCGLRSFGLESQTPPLMLSDAPTDMFFSADSMHLYVPVKGDTLGSNGFISVFSVEGGTVAANDTRSTPEGIQLLFGGFLVPGSENKIFVSDAGYGAVVFEFDGESHGTLIGKTISTPLVQALCWTKYSPVSKSAWVTSAISSAILEIDVETSALVSQTNLTNPNTGILDFVVPGRYLYGLAPGIRSGSEAGIIVVDISAGPEVVQFYPIGHNVTNTAIGMAYWG